MDNQRGCAAKPFRAVIFDVDGVLVASPHERAWREALAELMATEWRATPGRYAPDGFSTRVYLEHVAGKARLAGARAALAYFEVPDLEHRTLTYATRKQQRLEALIDAGEFVAFDDALRLVLAARSHGLRLARRVVVEERRPLHGTYSARARRSVSGAPCAGAPGHALRRIRGERLRGGSTPEQA